CPSRVTVMMNGESATCVARPVTAVPSCYRLSVMSGALEVTARIKNVADLELLISVLVANKILFATDDQKADTGAPSVKEGRSITKSSAKANESRRKAFAEDSETEILTLT